ncbi:hypothetical protein FQN60_001274 [Etheostoma spectabile]|uniref:Uncharacterized protein n=1 Tax=Etheostoma spectabile TaxID=54343 RepID=A0A5J5D570_9PERO|nr:hypothetical protein FQN60_001274 [Etheostoma spectabile]
MLSFKGHSEELCLPALVSALPLLPYWEIHPLVSAQSRQRRPLHRSQKAAHGS